MVVVPYYNKPTQEGLFRHFVEVAASVRLPVVVYNIPGRTVVDLAARDARAHLRGRAERRRHEGGDGQRRCARRSSLRRWAIASSCSAGDDALTLPMIAVGARGVISVTSNVLPAEVIAGHAPRARRQARRGAPGAPRAPAGPRGDVPRGQPRPGEGGPRDARGDAGDRPAAARAPSEESTRKAIAAALEAYAKGAR